VLPLYTEGPPVDPFRPWLASVCWLWFMRSVFVFTFVCTIFFCYCPPSSLAPVSSAPGPFLTTRVFLKQIYGGLNTLIFWSQSETWKVFECSSDNGADPISDDPPCLFSIAAWFLPIGFSMTSLPILLWLCISFNDDWKAKFIRTHKLRVRDSVNRFSKLSFFTLAASLCTITAASAFQFLNQLDYEGNEAAFFKQVGILFFVAVSFAPFFSLILVFYAETRRMRFVVADFIAQIRAHARQPGDVLFVLYSDLISEFEILQDHFGTIIAIQVGGFAASDVSCFIITYFAGKLPGEVILSVLPIPTAILLVTLA
jgi:hypothetical protein